MKIGTTVKYFDKSFGRYGDGMFDKIKELGFDFVDFNLSDTDSLFYGNDGLSLVENIRNLADRAGVIINQIHGPWRYLPKDETAEDRQERFEKMTRAIEFSKILGSKYMVIHPLMPHTRDDSGREEEFYKLNIDFMKKITEKAIKSDVIICLENMPMLNLSYSKPDRILDIIKEINDDNFMMCLDTGHISVFKELDVAEEIRRCDKFIKTFHIHDNKCSKDLHLMPYYGVTDWKKVSDAIKDIGFDGVFSMEVKMPDIADNTLFEKSVLLLRDIANSIVN